MKETSRRDIMSAALPAGIALAAATGAAVTARAATTTQSLTSAVSSLVPGVGGFIGTVTLLPNSVFVAANGALSAAATLSGNVINAATGAVTPITQQLTVPLQVSGSCQILTLTLGPLDLNLLGLAIHLNQVVLTITAVPGAGNLLGNLLCAVANLLNPGGPLSNLLNQLAGLINQILAAL